MFKKIKSAKRLFPAVFILTLILALIMSIYVCSQKNQWYIDEVWTYGLSNSYEKPFLFEWVYNAAPDEGIYEPRLGLDDLKGEFMNMWQKGDAYKDYLTVQSGEGFAYDTVFSNQANDVHPPFYYLIIHTICSFFPDTYSKWFVFVPNILFYIISLVLLYKVSYTLTESRAKGIITMIFWGFSCGAIKNLVFGRMYMLLTLLILSLLLIHIIVLKKGEFTFKNTIPLIFISLAGFLTQYYFYFFAFFSAAVTCFIFLGKKKWKSLFIYAGSMLFSVGAAIIIFPATLTHVFNSPYSISSNSNSFTLYRILSSLMRCNKVILENCLGISAADFNYYVSLLFLIALPVIILVLFVAYKALKYAKNGEKFEIKIEYLFVVLSLFLTLWVVAYISPTYGEYSDRYFYALYPLISLFLIFIIFSCSKKLVFYFKKLPVLLLPLLVCVFCGIGGFMQYELINESQAGAMTNEEIGILIEDKNCVIKPEKEHHIHVNAPELMKAKRVFAAGKSVNLEDLINSIEEDDTVLFLDINNDNYIDTSVLEDEFEYLGSTIWGNTSFDAVFDVYYIRTGK